MLSSWGGPISKSRNMLYTDQKKIFHSLGYIQISEIPFQEKEQYLKTSRRPVFAENNGMTLKTL